MSEQKFYAVMCLFDEKTNNEFKIIEENLQIVGIKSRSIPPHITLGAYVNIEENTLVEWTKKFCEENSKISVNFSHLGVFNQNVLFVAPRVSKELLHFHELFHQKYDENCGEIGFLYSLKSNKWVPHATVIIDDFESVQKLLTRISDIFKPIESEIVGLSISEFYPMREIARFDLLV